ncbi:hypothetical protein [Natronorubrum sp. DTA28]|uniref:hypothetical protein n=1 Tax=Natronorubrum sp. DTA28 TaxID=3447019 RepID=UPI003F837754
MSDSTDETGKDEHGRDVELAHEDTEDDEEGLTEEEMEARKRQDEEEIRQDIEHRSDDRVGDAREQENPDNHRDEEPHNS